MKNWGFDMILLLLKRFCFIENLIEWQNSQKAYKKQTLEQQSYAKKYTVRNKTLLNVEYEIIFHVHSVI